MVAKAAKIPAPITKPNLVCPFTGKPIEIRRVAGGIKWMGASSNEHGGYVTSLFGTEDELVFFLSMRNGVEPAFRKYGPEITVRERQPSSPDPLADEREKGKALDELAKNCVDRVLSGK